MSNNKDLLTYLLTYMKHILTAVLNRTVGSRLTYSYEVHLQDLDNLGLLIAQVRTRLSRQGVVIHSASWLANKPGDSPVPSDLQL